MDQLLGIDRAVGGLPALEQHDAISEKRKTKMDPLQLRPGFPGQPFALADPTQGDVRKEGPSLGRVANVLTGPLEPILQELELRISLHFQSQNSSPTQGRKGASAAQYQLDGTGVPGGPAQRFLDGVEPVGGHLAEELEGEM
jgi:hypothetical protein